MFYLFKPFPGIMCFRPKKVIDFRKEKKNNFYFTWFWLELILYKLRIILTKAFVYGISA